jgi:O-antigen/teichoic acid export membrane protein
VDELVADNGFVGQGITLFLDQLVISAGNWLFWIVISRIASITQIGEATAVLTLVLFLSTLGQLGLEYPLLRKAATEGRRIFGSVFLIDSAITVASAGAIMLLAWSDSYHESLQSFAWFAILLLITSNLMFVGRFALLGIFKVRDVFFFDILGTALKFVIAFALLSFGFGVPALLTSFVIQNLAIGIGSISIVMKVLGVPSVRRLGSQAIHYLTDVAKVALANTPSKLSRALIISLSVVLITVAGSSDSDIGTFYIILMISVVAGSLASSIAVMVVPASSATLNRTDPRTGNESNKMFVNSLRIGLCLTVPFISVMVATPNVVLFALGEQFVSSSPILAILAMSIFPQTVVMNSISKLNTARQTRSIILLGGVQTSVFLIAFFILVPMYSTFGAAFAILLGYSIPAVLALRWYERQALRYVTFSGSAAAAGVVFAFLTKSIFAGSTGSLMGSEFESIIVAATAALTSIFVIVLTRSLSVTEILHLGRMAIQNVSTGRS